MNAIVRGISIDAVGIDGVADRAREIVANREPSYVCLANVHVLETARNDAALRSALANATLRLPDGSPVAWAASRALRRRVGRVTGSDVFASLLSRPGWRHYFYGSTSDVLERLVESVRARYPDAVVAGFHSPPFRPLTPDELAADAARIDAARPDVVWVGLGAPRQEIWMSDARPHLEAPLLVGVGAVFDFVAGTRSRAPRSVQRIGLEWLYRLLQEPSRLGPRYLRTNASFVGSAVRGVVSRRGTAT